MSRLVLLALILAFVLTSCEREKREARDRQAPGARSPAIAEGTLFPGETAPAMPEAAGLYVENAYAMSEGKRLFTWFNCTGCHAHGGGGIGPPLMDDHWIYGAAPQNIFATILEGRPNGMPSFRGRITDQQAWQLAAYVRSMSGLAPKAAAPGRDDALAARPAESATQPAQPDTTVPPANPAP